MKLLLQRVKEASVTVSGETIGAIGPGLLVLFGVHQNDTAEPLDYCMNKLLNLRIFEDEKSLLEIEGELLIVSQFTLYADTRKGRRPSYIDAARPEKAKEIYNLLIQKLEKECPGKVQTGEFGADMQVSLTNDGPVTILIERKS